LALIDREQLDLTGALRPADVGKAQSLQAETVFGRHHLCRRSSDQASRSLAARYRAAQFEDALARFLTTQAEHPNTQEWGRRKDVKVFGLIALDAALGATEVKRLYEVLEKRLAEVKARPSPLQTSWRSAFVSVRRNRMAIASSATTANVFSMVSFLPREILGRAS
jgi:hypothetical protein